MTSCKNSITKGDVNTFQNTTKPAARGLSQGYSSDEKECIRDELVDRGLPESEANDRLMLEE